MTLPTNPDGLTPTARALYSWLCRPGATLAHQGDAVAASKLSRSSIQRAERELVRLGHLDPSTKLLRQTDS